jgi:hypothetical protein
VDTIERVLPSKLLKLSAAPHRDLHPCACRPR